MNELSRDLFYPDLRLSVTPAIATLFETPELWIAAHGTRFTPRAVVTSLLERKDKTIPTSRDFSAMIAQRMNMLERRYALRPIAVTPKQRHQYWDEAFVLAFLASIEFDNTSPWNHVNKVAYRIRETVTDRELLAVAAAVPLSRRENFATALSR